MALAALGLAYVAASQRGVLIGLLLLAIMNGIPLIDTYAEIGGLIRLQDIAVSALFLAALSWAVLDSTTFQPSETGRWISMFAAALLLWWLWTITLTVINQHVPPANAIGYGRDFLYFGLLLAVLPRVRFEARDLICLLGVLAIGTCIFAVGQIATTVGIGGLGWLINVRYTTHEAGLIRVYAFMTDIVVFMLAISVAAFLTATQRLIRVVAVPLALLMLISTALTLTRAYWIGLTISFVLVTLWNLSGSRRFRLRISRMLGISALILIAVGVILAIAAPDTLSSGAILSRLSSIFSDLQGSGGTVGVREIAARTTAGYLGEDWLGGLGFVPPSSHYYFGLLEGSIRDSDLGFLGAVVTMGAVGAVLIYAPVILVLRQCLQRPLIGSSQISWLLYGGAIWIGATLISSVTLVTLFGVSGLALTAVVLAVLTQPELARATLPGAASVRRRAGLGPESAIVGGA